MKVKGVRWCEVVGLPWNIKILFPNKHILNGYQSFYLCPPDNEVMKSLYLAFYKFRELISLILFSQINHRSRQHCCREVFFSQMDTRFTNSAQYKPLEEKTYLYGKLTYMVLGINMGNSKWDYIVLGPLHYVLHMQDIIYNYLAKASGHYSQWVDDWFKDTCFLPWKAIATHILINN